MVCKVCSAKIIKKVNESQKCFEARKYCSQKCFGKTLVKLPSVKQIEKKKRKEERAGYSTRNYSHPIYDAWRNMKRRCYGNYANSKIYKNYGGRGIEVCQEWKDDFNSFLKWSLKNSWMQGLTIDRINNDGNYEPNNCRWVSRIEQLSNRRNSIYITYNGETKTEKEWAKLLNISYTAFRKRIKNWGNLTKVMNEPIDTSKIRYKKTN